MKNWKLRALALLLLLSMALTGCAAGTETEAAAGEEEAWIDSVTLEEVDLEDEAVALGGLRGYPGHHAAGGLRYPGEKER